MKEMSSGCWPALRRSSRSQVVRGHTYPITASIGTISVHTRCGRRNAGRRTHSQRSATPSQISISPTTTNSTYPRCRTTIRSASAAADIPRILRPAPTHRERPPATTWHQPGSSLPLLLSIRQRRPPRPSLPPSPQLHASLRQEQPITALERRVRRRRGAALDPPPERLLPVPAHLDVLVEVDELVR